MRMPPRDIPVSFYLYLKYNSSLLSCRNFDKCQYAKRCHANNNMVISYFCNSNACPLSTRIIVLVYLNVLSCCNAGHIKVYRRRIKVYGCVDSCNIQYPAANRCRLCFCRIGMTGKNFQNGESLVARCTIDNNIASL